MKGVVYGRSNFCFVRSHIRTSYVRSTFTPQNKGFKTMIDSMLDVLLDNSPKEVAKMSKFLNSIKDEVEQRRNA